MICTLIANKDGNKLFCYFVFFFFNQITGQKSTIFINTFSSAMKSQADKKTSPLSDLDFFFSPNVKQVLALG